MANLRPFNQQFFRLLILLILVFDLQRPLNAEGIFSSFQRRLIKPTSIVKGFFKSFKTFQDPIPSPPLTQEDYLMQQAFNSPPNLPVGSSSNGAPISEYLVSNFAHLNSNNLNRPFGSALKKEPMVLSESIPRSNVLYPNMMNGGPPINHNLIYDQSQKASSQADLEDYPAPSQHVNYQAPNEKASPSLSIGSAPGGGIGLKLGKFQMTFRRGNDGPQINLGTNDETPSDQEAENSYVSMTRSKDKKKGMNIRLGKALQFSIGGNQDAADEDKMKGSSSNRNMINFGGPKNHFNRKSNSNNNLMSSASENNYDESPGISLPAISIGGNGNGRPAITIGGDSDDGSEGGYARPQITIGGGDPDYSNSNNNQAQNNYNAPPPPQQQGNNGWSDHWERPRIRMKMPDFPQTYIEKNLKLPPIKLKINASPRVKITTGTKDPLEKKPIEEPVDMQDIFRPPEPFTFTNTTAEKNDTNTNDMNNGMNDGMNGNNGFNNGNFDSKFNPNYSPYSDPNYQQYPIQQQNEYPEQINFVSKQQFDEQQSYERNHNKYYSYNYHTDQQSKYQYDNTVGETKSSRSNTFNNNKQMPQRKENLQRGESSNDAPIYNDGGYPRPPPNYNTYHVDNNNNRYPVKQNYNQMSNNYPQPPQLPNQYNQPPAGFNGGSQYNQYNEPPNNYNRNPPLPPPIYHNNNNNYNGNGNNNNHNNNNYNTNQYGGKTKEQIEEENAIYIKSKDEYAEDRPQIIMDMRPKISISHVNATHPEPEKDPRHKNPFFKMIMNPEFVNVTTPEPEFDDDYGAVGYNKHYPNHYDFNKYKGHKPGKFGINYVKRTTTQRPIVDKNRKSLTTTESTKDDADDPDYYDETTTTTMATTTTTMSDRGSTKDDDDEDTSTKSSTTKDPDDELENTTSFDKSSTTTESSASKSDGTSTKKDEDDDDDDDDEVLRKKLTTTLKPGETTSTTTVKSTSSTTQDPLNKKLTTSKPAKKATTTTASPDDEFEDYFDFITKTNKTRKKMKPSTTILPIGDDTTTPSDDDSDDVSNEKITSGANKKKEAQVGNSKKEEKKEDFFTTMMKTLRSEKNGGNEDDEDKKEATTSIRSKTTEPSTTTDSDDDDDEDVTLSTTTSKSKIKGRNQTDRSEALVFTTEQSTSSSGLSPKRNRADTAKKEFKSDKRAGINISDYETEVTTITDKTMLQNLFRMMNDTMAEMMRMRTTTPCPTNNNSESSSKQSTEENEVMSSSKSTTEATTPSTTTATDEDDEKEDEDSDEKTSSTSSTTSKTSTALTTKETTVNESTTTEKSSSTTSKDDDEDSDDSDESSSTTAKPTTTSNEEAKTTKLQQQSEKVEDEKEDEDEEDNENKVSITKETLTSTESTTVLKNKQTKSPFGVRITSSAKGSKVTENKNMKSTSSFEISSEKLVIASSTESSVSSFSSSLTSLNSKSTSDGNKSTADESIDDDNRISIDIKEDLDSLKSLNSSLSSQLDNAESITDQQKQSNEPIIVVLLPNEESKL